MFQSVITVRYGETDQMGVVYHANYIPWLEVAREEYMEALGYKYAKMEEMGILIPVFEVHCKYIKPARYGEKVLVKVKLKSFKGIKLFFEYEILNADHNELLAKAETGHTFIDQSFNPIAIKKAHPDFYEALLTEAREDQLI